MQLNIKNMRITLILHIHISATYFDFTIARKLKKIKNINQLKYSLSIHVHNKEVYNQNLCW